MTSIFLMLFISVLLTIPRISIGANSFMCTGGSFKDSVGLYKGSTEGQCVKYARYEIGGDQYYDLCNGDITNKLLLVPVMSAGNQAL